MATITAEGLAKTRQGYRETEEGNPTKEQIDAAIQAIEDWFNKTAVQSSLKADIDAATSPFTFTATQAKKLAKWWMRDRFFRD
jgi:alcohol dehydrogenase YqhD (iron-dependent ADH family)